MTTGVGSKILLVGNGAAISTDYLVSYLFYSKSKILEAKGVCHHRCYFVNEKKLAKISKIRKMSDKERM